MNISTLFYGTAVACLMTGTANAQQRRINYNLQQWLAAGKLEVVNREAAQEPGGGIRLSAADGDGVAWLKGVDFSDGVIEVDVRGRNADQKSFLGIAFHGADAGTLDAVYFRPFNFPATDSAKRSHMVEYVSHPQYPWQLLREKFNGQYEKVLSHPPGPDNWFHVRIEVHFPGIRVFVNGNPKPCLDIKQLDGRKSGRIGLWVGNGSDGAFAHLKLLPRK